MSGSPTNNTVTISGLNGDAPVTLSGEPKAGCAALSNGRPVIALLLGQTPDGKPVQIEIGLHDLGYLGDLIYQGTHAAHRLAAFLPREATA